MPDPIKKSKKKKRAIKINPKAQFQDGTGLLEKDLKDYLKKSRSNVDVTLKPGGKGFVPRPLATGAITPDNNPATLFMPVGRGLKMLNQYRKSISTSAFNLIKKKITDKTPYGVIGNLIESAVAASTYSEDEEQDPSKLSKGGSVRTIKKGNSKR